MLSFESLVSKISYKGLVSMLSFKFQILVSKEFRRIVLNIVREPLF